MLRRSRRGRNNEECSGEDNKPMAVKADEQQDSQCVRKRFSVDNAQVGTWYPLASTSGIIFEINECMNNWTQSNPRKRCK